MSATLPVPQRISASRAKSARVADILRTIVILALSVLMLFPFFWVVTTALKGNSDIYKIPPEIFPREFHWENFSKGIKAVNFGLLFRNSVLLAVLTTIGYVTSSMIVGYGLSRIRFPGRKIWFYVFVGSMMLPGVISLFPVFRLFLALGLYDTWYPLVLPAFLGNPFYIFLARQYYLSIPFSLDEAAKLDGANHWTIFTKIMLPITSPLWITMAIFAFQGSWNDYLTPLIYLPSEEKWPLSVGMASFIGAFAGVSNTKWNQFMATNLLYMLPPLIIFFLAQRYFMAGLGTLGTTTRR